MGFNSGVLSLSARIPHNLNANGHRSVAIQDGHWVYGYDDSGRPIYGYNKSDVPICNGNKGKCRDVLRMANGRCRRCGGKALSGPDLPQYKNGACSKMKAGLSAIQNRLTQSRGKDGRIPLEHALDNIDALQDSQSEAISLKASMAIAELGARELPLIIDPHVYRLAVQAFCALWEIETGALPSDDQVGRWEGLFFEQAKLLPASL